MIGRLGEALTRARSAVTDRRLKLFRDLAVLSIPGPA